MIWFGDSQFIPSALCGEEAIAITILSMPGSLQYRLALYLDNWLWDTEPCTH